MTTSSARSVVHLELHTGDPQGAGAFLEGLCGWRAEWIGAASARSYLALGLGGVEGGGIVECETPRPLWLPYVEVPEIAAATEAARRLGAHVLLEPREGPYGWRSAISDPRAGVLGLWQAKAGR